MKFKSLILLLLLIFLIGSLGVYLYESKTKMGIGLAVDNFKGVAVYYNGRVGNISGRNLTPDNCNLGLKYQCVEFVKRFYYEHLNHKMPDSYGHAKDFFNPAVKDGEINKQRNLIQYTNSSKARPRVNDLIIFRGTTFNKYGHVAIISAVKESELEIIQQNPGIFGSSRDKIALKKIKGKWRVIDSDVLGWLRLEK